MHSHVYEEKVSANVDFGIDLLWGTNWDYINETLWPGEIYFDIVHDYNRELTYIEMPKFILHSNSTIDFTINDDIDFTYLYYVRNWYSASEMNAMSKEETFLYDGKVHKYSLPRDDIEFRDLDKRDTNFFIMNEKIDKLKLSDINSLNVNIGMKPMSWDKKPSIELDVTLDHSVNEPDFVEEPMYAGESFSVKLLDRIRVFVSSGYHTHEVAQLAAEDGSRTFPQNGLMHVESHDKVESMYHASTFSTEPMKVFGDNQNVFDYQFNSSHSHLFPEIENSFLGELHSPNSMGNFKLRTYFFEDGTNEIDERRGKIKIIDYTYYDYRYKRVRIGHGPNSIMGEKYPLGLSGDLDGYFSRNISFRVLDNSKQFHVEWIEHLGFPWLDPQFGKIILEIEEAEEKDMQYKYFTSHELEMLCTTILPYEEIERMGQYA